MEIRKAIDSDYIKIVRTIQNKKIDFITPAHVKKDISLGQQFIMVDNNKVIAILSLVYDANYNYFAMRRLCIPNKRNNGKGYAKMMIEYVSSQANGKVGGTPWVDNLVARHLLEKLGFSLEYIFAEKWCFYSKNN